MSCATWNLQFSIVGTDENATESDNRMGSTHLTATLAAGISFSATIDADPPTTSWSVDQINLLPCMVKDFQ
jgi:hypothetical protein